MDGYGLVPLAISLATQSRKPDVHSNVLPSKRISLLHWASQSLLPGAEMLQQYNSSRCPYIMRSHLPHSDFFLFS